MLWYSIMGSVKGARFFLASQMTPFWPGSVKINDILTHTSSNEEGGIIISPDLVILR